MKRIVSADQL
ncbi:hypothetical protein Egran_06532, partial [Elaphomyces granulatus]